MEPIILKAKRTVYKHCILAELFLLEVRVDNSETNKMHSGIEQLAKQMADVWSQILYYWSRRFYQEEDRIIHVMMDYNLRHQYELMINLQMGIHINIHCCSVAQS